MIERNQPALSEGRRRKIVPMAAPLLCMLLTQGTTLRVECVTGIPEGASFIGIAYDAQRDIFLLCFESDEWDIVPFDQELPWYTVMYRNIQ